MKSAMEFCSRASSSLRKDRGVLQTGHELAKTEPGCGGTADLMTVMISVGQLGQ